MLIYNNAMQKPKAIIFDCFGVLVESSLIPFNNRHFSGDTNKLETSAALDNAANKGDITHPQFVEKVSNLAGISVEQANQELDTNPPNVRLLTYIKEVLKPHYKIGFLSNASDNWLASLFTPDQLALFDDFVLSYEHGMAKPEAAIYGLAAKRLGVAAADSIFIDDVPAYCDAARKFGMQSIVYSRFETFKTELETLLGVN